MEGITSEWPHDLLTAKFAVFVYYVLGQQHMGPRFRSHMARLEPMHAGDPDFLAMAAFASELCGDYGAAESTAERALAAAQRNPWAQLGRSSGHAILEAVGECVRIHAAVGAEHLVQQAPHRCVGRSSARALTIAPQRRNLASLGDSLVNQPGLTDALLTDHFDEAA